LEIHVFTKPRAEASPNELAAIALLVRDVIAERSRGKCLKKAAKRTFAAISVCKASRACSKQDLLEDAQREDFSSISAANQAEDAKHGL